MERVREFSSAVSTGSIGKTIPVTSFDEETMSYIVLCFLKRNVSSIDIVKNDEGLLNDSAYISAQFAIYVG